MVVSTLTVPTLSLKKHGLGLNHGIMLSLRSQLVDNTVFHAIQLRRLRPSTTAIWTFLLFCAGLSLSLAVYGQSASASFKTAKSHVFVGEKLPFQVTITNPTTTDLTAVRYTVDFPAETKIGNLDDECVYSPLLAEPISCLVPKIEAGESYSGDFYIEGSEDLYPSFAATLAVSNSSGTIAIDEQSTASTGLADGNREISGTTLSLTVGRNIRFDADRDGSPDIDEVILGTDPANANSVFEGNAVIDVLFLISPAATAYWQGRTDEQVVRIINSTNAAYAHNNIFITLRNVGIEAVNYTDTVTDMSTVLADLSGGSHSAFTSVDTLRTLSGADLVVMLHAIDGSESLACRVASLIGVGTQGDFRADTHAGTLLSAANIGPRCHGTDFSGLFSINMGIVASRAEAPEGGTFSFSAGHGVANIFVTRRANALGGGQPFGSVPRVNLFSDPRKLCLGHACGVDQDDIALGADAVRSMNYTRHLVGALTDRTVSPEPVLVDPLTQVAAVASGQLTVQMTALNTAAFLQDFIRVRVDVRNNSQRLFRQVAVQPFNRTTSNFYRADASACTLFSSTVATPPSLRDGLTEGAGVLSCYIGDLEPQATKSFEYFLRLEEVETLGTQGYFRESLLVNSEAAIDVGICLPIFGSLDTLLAGSDVCQHVPTVFRSIDPSQAGAVNNPPVVVLTDVPSVNGSVLTLPFVRLSDGSLYQAQLRILSLQSLNLELIAATQLSSSLAPTLESTLSANNVLTVPSLTVNGVANTLSATLVVNSNPARFDNLVLMPQ